MKLVDIIIAFFIIATGAFVGLGAILSMAQGTQGMGYVLGGCIACVIGGFAIVAREFCKQ